MQTLLQWAAVIWLVVMGLLVAYGFVSSLLLRRQVRVSLRLQDRVYACDDVASPFVLGVFFPKIYVPSDLSRKQLQHVLAHEYAHLKRRDHWWKPLGFALLCVYWFNPLMWVAYVLLTRDIEQACDEKVIASMSKAQKKGYSETLAACSMQRRMILVCPVAFGEVSVKTRIKGILNYKKPAFWVIAAAVAACMAVAVCFLTDPIPCSHQYEGKVTLSSTCITGGKETYTCKKCRHSYVKNTAVHDHTYGDGVVIKQASCTDEGLVEYTCVGCGKIDQRVLGVIPHTVEDVTVTTEPNCTQSGMGTGICTVCGNNVTVTLPVNDHHDLTETVIKAPTCTDSGEGLRTCARCGYEEKCTYELLAHNFKETYIEHATCFHEGRRKITCEDCGRYAWETIPRVMSHVWEDTHGGYVRRCKICGSVQYTSTSNSSLDPNRYYTPLPYSSNWTGKPQFPVIIWDP